jgi:hypothetical protein
MRESAMSLKGQYDYFSETTSLRMSSVFTVLFLSSQYMRSKERDNLGLVHTVAVIYETYFKSLFSAKNANFHDRPNIFIFYPIPDAGSP